MAEHTRREARGSFIVRSGVRLMNVYDSDDDAGYRIDAIAMTIKLSNRRRWRRSRRSFGGVRHSASFSPTSA